MKIKKLAACILAASVLIFAAAAQDEWDSSDDGFDSFGDDSFGDDSFGSFDDDFGSFGDSSSSGLFGGLPITFSGRLSFDGRYYFAKDDSKYFLNNYMSLDADNLSFKDNRTLTTMIKWGDTYPEIEDRDEEDEARLEEKYGYRKVDYADNTLVAFPAARLGIGYSGNKADASLLLNLTEDTLKNNQIDIIDELILRGYFIDNRFTVEAGKMKVVWGKGDKLHVLDNFNADDYKDFIIPDYIDRRISTPMLRGVYSFNTEQPFTIEALWTPFLPKDRFDMEGIWMPASYAKLTTITKAALIMKASNMLNSGNASGLDDLADLAEFNVNDMYPDTNSLKYTQGGLKFSGTAGAFDWGVSYYIGRYKQPSANLDNIVVPIAKAQKYKTAAEQYAEAAKTSAEKAAKAASAAEAAKHAQEAANYKTLAEEAKQNAENALTEIGLPTLDYDRKQTVGFEFATIIGRFNLRGEAGFNVTEDWSGDNPWVHNNSIQWLFGFDFDLPISNLNINIQETGTYILNSGEIKDGEFEEFDVDYDPKKRYTNDKLVINISDSWAHDHFKPEMTLMWGIERGDFVFQPKLTYAPNPNLSFALSGMMIYSKDRYSEFYNWKNNDFINLGVKFEF